MSLTIFSTSVLSLVFAVVFWAWLGKDSGVMVYIAMTLGALALFAVASFFILGRSLFPIRRDQSHKMPVFDGTMWSTKISTGLTTPAAVIRGYVVVFANRPFLEELGMPSMSDQIIGMPITNLIHPKDHEHLARLIANLSSGNEAVPSLRLSLMRFDGSSAVHEISFSLLSKETLPSQVLSHPLPAKHALASDSLLGQDREALMLLQFNHITPARMIGADAAINHRLLIEQIEQIIFQADINGQLIFANPSWEKLLHHTADELAGKPLLNYIHPEDRPIADAHLNAIRFGKRATCHLEVRMLAKNGDASWCEIRARAASSAEGEKTSIIGTLTDIQRAKQSEAALRANRKSLNTLLSNIPGMIYRAKNNGKWSMEFVSDGCVEITGYEAHEFVGDHEFSYHHIIYPEDRTFALAYLHEQLVKKQRYGLTYRIYTRTNTIKWVFEYGTGVFSSADELLAMEGFIIDAPTDADLLTPPTNARAIPLQHAED